MAKRDPLAPKREMYFDLTLRPMNCLVFIAPMLIFYHVAAMFWKMNLLAARDVHLVLQYFGVTVAYLPAGLLVALLIVHHILRRDPWRPQGGVLLGMFFESILETGPLILLGLISGRVIVNAATGAPPMGAGAVLAAGVGAAVYEEFIFRMLLIGIIALVFVDVLDWDKHIVLTVAVLATAAVFSLYHYRASVEFSMNDFIFRMLAGAYLGAIYVTRGLGIAAGVHAAFNIYASLFHMWTGR